MENRIEIAEALFKDGYNCAQSVFAAFSDSKKAFDLMEQQCTQKKLGKIWLTVNRNNDSSIKTYENLGFTITTTKVADIGAGFVMDDYIMEKSIS